MSDYLDRDPSIFPVLPISATGPPLESDSPQNGLPTLDPATGGVRVTLTGGGGGPATEVEVTNFPASTEIANDVGNPVPVSAASLPLPSGAATESTLAALNAKVTAVDTSALSLETTQTTVRNNIGATNEAAAGTDTASSGLNGLIKRLLQKFTAQIPAALGQTTSVNSLSVVVASDQSAVPVSGTVTANAGTNLNTSALALDATLGTTNTRVGDLTESAPGTDTASSGLNGRLQRLAQRLASLIALFPVSIGQKTSAGSLSVVLASDQPAAPVTVTADPRQTYSTFGDLITAKRTPQAVYRADYGVIAGLHTSTVTNGGTVTVDSGRFKASTNGSANATAYFRTNRVVRYVNGFTGYVEFTAVWSAPGANGIQLIGVGNPATDSIHLGYYGTDFVVGHTNNGAAPTNVDQASWSQNGLYSAFSTSFLNIYRIAWGWLGAQGYVLLKQDPATGVFQPLHFLRYSNTSATPFLRNPTFPVFIYVANTSGATNNISLWSPSADGGVMGDPQSEYVHPNNVREAVNKLTTFSDTNENHLITIHNKTTAYAGSVENRAPISIRRIAVERAGSGAATVTLRIYNTLQTFGAALVYADKDTNNSPIEFSTTATTKAATSPYLEYTFSTAAPQETFTYLPQEFQVMPGGYLHFTAQDSSASGTDTRVTIEYDVEF